MDQKQITYTPESVAHPGDVLNDFLEDRKISAEDFAQEIKVNVAALKKILAEEAPIRKRLARKLAKVFEISEDYFVDYQADYDAYEKTEKEWAKKFHKNSIQRMVEKDMETWKKIHIFFDSCNWKSWEKYVGKEQEASFRISETAKKDKYAICTWLRIGEIEAESLSPKVAETFCLDKFEDALQAAKDLMAKHPQDFLKKLQKLCADVGVYLVYVPILPKATPDGATTWFKDRPLINLSLKGKSNDKFWFTFFHEAGHVMLHHEEVKIRGFFDDFDKNLSHQKNEKHEGEANEFAQQWTLTNEQMERVKNLWHSKEDKKKQKLIGLAKEFNTHPGVIVGRMQKEKIAKYNFRQLNELKERLEPAHFEKKGSCILI